MSWQFAVLALAKSDSSSAPVRPVVAPLLAEVAAKSHCVPAATARMDAGRGASSTEAELLGCLFDQWYAPHPGLGGRSAGWSTDEELGRSGTYGELLPTGGTLLLDYVKGLAPLSVDDIFADLGSGRGRILLQVVLTTPAQAVGVELSEVRSAAAHGAAARLRLMAPALEARLALHQGDLRETAHSWSGASVMFINSAAFTPRLMFDMVKILVMELGPGALVFSIRRLPGCHRGLGLVDEVLLPFTWGRETVHIYAVAPKPRILNGPIAWLASLNWSEASNLTEALQELTQKPLHIPGICTQLALSHWRMQAPQLALRWCALVTGVNSSDAVRLSRCSVSLWLRSWWDGLPSSNGTTASPTECAWRELQGRHEAERKGAAMGSHAAMSFINSLSNISLRDEIGSTILHHGAMAGAPKVLEALLRVKRLEYEHHPELVDLMDGMGRSPLNLAVEEDTIALLLQARGDISQCGVKCQQGGVLAAATRMCMGMDIVPMLVEVTGPVGINSAVDGEGQTPLHLAAGASCSFNSTGAEAALHSLLMGRAVVTTRDGVGRTPLHMARDAMVAHVLLAARAEVNARDELAGSSPLHSAVMRRGSEGAVRVLLEARAAPGALDREGTTPLTRAVRESDRLLLRAAHGHTGEL